MNKVGNADCMCHICREEAKRALQGVCMCHIGRDEEQEQEHRKKEEKPRKKSLHASYLP
jgi:hypothetical protein